MATTETQFDWLAYLGGALFAICLMPQIRLMWLKSSAEDVSLSWTILYFFGMTIQILYCFLMHADTLGFSMLPEWTATILLVFTKMYFDYRLRKNTSKEEKFQCEADAWATMDDIECKHCD